MKNLKVSKDSVDSTGQTSKVSSNVCRNSLQYLVCLIVNFWLPVNKSMMVKLTGRHSAMSNGCSLNMPYNVDIALKVYCG